MHHRVRVLLEMTLRCCIIVVDLRIGTRLVVVIDVVVALEHALVCLGWCTRITH